MLIVGLGVLWVGYGLGMTGWVLVRGYNVSLKEIWWPTGWYSGAWPPDPAPNTVLWPTGQAGSSGVSGSTGTGVANKVPGNVKGTTREIRETSPTGTTNPK